MTHTLKDKRLDMGLTQTEFADLVGVHGVTVSQWENGRVPLPRHLRKLAEVLKLPIPEIRKLVTTAPAEPDAELQAV